MNYTSKLILALVDIKMKTTMFFFKKNTVTFLLIYFYLISLKHVSQ